MIQNLAVEIISPTGVVFEGKCHMVVIPSVNGDIGVMYNHESFVAKLKEGKISIFKDYDKKTNSFDVEGGFAEIQSEGKLLILID